MCVFWVEFITSMISCKIMKEKGKENRVGGNLL